LKIESPSRIVRTYTQKINGTPAQVFPLLCPVRETDWIEGWNAEIVYSNSGYAEQDCIFITDIGGKKTVWIINRYEPENNFVEMIRFTEELLVVKLAIKLTGTNAGTDADITFTYNAVSAEGKKELEKFTEEFYTKFMQDWEENMNYYLVNGTCRKR
jgi:hypothetical protein